MARGQISFFAHFDRFVFVIFKMHFLKYFPPCCSSPPLTEIASVIATSYTRPTNRYYALSSSSFLLVSPARASSQMKIRAETCHETFALKLIECPFSVLVVAIKTTKGVACKIYSNSSSYFFKPCTVCKTTNVCLAR